MGGAIFLPDHEQQVRLVAMKGASDDEIADMFNVSREVFQKWRKAYPSFNDAVMSGRTRADTEVVVSLYKRATGYDYEETVPTKSGKCVLVKKHAPPDVGAQQYWLNNRQPDNWRSSSTKHIAGRSREDDETLGVKIETRDEMISAILTLIEPKPDGATKAIGKDTAKNRQ